MFCCWIRHFGVWPDFQVKHPKSALCPLSGIFPVEFCTRWWSSVILRNGSGKRVAQMISHKRVRQKGWLQENSEQEINQSYIIRMEK